MTRKKIVSLFIPIALMTAAGCAKQNPAPSQIPAVPLPIMQVQRKNLAVRLTVSGTIAALPDHCVKAAPAISGKIASVSVVPGDHVRRGSVLARLDARQAQNQYFSALAAVKAAQANLLQAKTAAMLAENDLSRVSRLYGEKIAPQKDLIAGRSRLETARAETQAAEAQVEQARGAAGIAATQLGYTVIKSPIEGIVAARFQNAGDIAAPTLPIAQVVDLSRVILNADVPADGNARLRPGQPAEIFPVTVNSAFAPQGKGIHGKIISVSPVLDPQTNTYTARILCPNPGLSLKEGMAAKAIITLGWRRGVLAVLAGALVPNPNTMTNSMVYRYQAGTISRAPVRRGIESSGWVEITRGLREGEDVVASGAYGLPDGTHAAPAPSRSP